MNKIAYPFDNNCLPLKKSVIIQGVRKEVVPAPGLEPGRPFEQRILSPLRLPIPPSGHCSCTAAEPSAEIRIKESERTNLININRFFSLFFQSNSRRFRTTEHPKPNCY